MFCRQLFDKQFTSCFLISAIPVGYVTIAIQTNINSQFFSKESHEQSNGPNTINWQLCRRVQLKLVVQFSHYPVARWLEWRCLIRFSSTVAAAGPFRRSTSCLVIYYSARFGQLTIHRPWLCDGAGRVDSHTGGHGGWVQGRSDGDEIMRVGLTVRSIHLFSGL